MTEPATQAGAGPTVALRSNKTGTSTLTWLAADQHGTSSLAVDATTQAVTKRYTTPFGAPPRPAAAEPGPTTKPSSVPPPTRQAA